MKRVIWKYTLQPEVRQTFLVPAGGEFLFAQKQRGVPCVWAMVDPEQPLEERHIRLEHTGTPFEAENLGRFLGTVLLYDGALVVHVFEEN